MCPNKSLQSVQRYVTFGEKLDFKGSVREK